LSAADRQTLGLWAAPLKSVADYQIGSILTPSLPQSDQFEFFELATERKLAMPFSISTLLTRNLDDVFGENDPKRRRAAIDAIFTEDCVFYEPSGHVYRGRDEIDRVAGAIRATHPDFRYQQTAKPEELGNAGRIQWIEGRAGEGPAQAGTDFIIARDGRIAAVYLFFDKLPAGTMRRERED
jgi:SnoaL-like domain